MRAGWLSWMCLVLGGCASGGGFEPTERAVLDDAERAELYALHPYPQESGSGDAAFHGYRVLGRAELGSKEEREKLIEAAQKAISSSDGRMAKCFNPRHGVRIAARGGTVDLVICFECFQMKVITGGSERIVAIGTEAEAEFDRALARHKLTKSRD